MGYALKTITALPFGNIIGNPLKAAIEAQAIAAKSTVDFIQTVGFKPKDSDTDPFFEVDTAGEVTTEADIGEVRNVTFKYTVKDAEGVESEASLAVPILTIVPIPFIRIDEMNIDFMAKISEQQNFARKTDSEKKFGIDTSVKGGARWWWASVSVGVNTSYSSRHSSSTEASSRYQTEMTMNVSVRAVQDELPAGLSRVLNMLESIIKEERKAIATTTQTSTTTSTTK